MTSTNQKAKTMKPAIKFSLIFAILALTIALAFILTGCEGADLQVAYYTPNWLPDGRIIANKDEWYTVNQMFATAMTTRRINWVVTMDENGENEQKLFFRDSTTPIFPSPDGSKLGIGYRIYDYKGKVLDELPTQNINNRPFWFGIMDWSPDSTKVVGDYILGKVYYYDLKTKQVTYVDEGYEPAWLDNERIIFMKRDNAKKGYGYWAIHNVADKNEIKTSVVMAFPKNYRNNLIFAYINGIYAVIEPLTNKVIGKCKPHDVGYYLAHLSSDGKKVIACDSGSKGIYITDFESGETRMIKSNNYVAIKKK